MYTEFGLHVNFVVHSPVSGFTNPKPAEVLIYNEYGSFASQLE